MPRRKKASTLSAIQPFLLDTNIILPFLIGDDPENATRSTALMERVERSEEVVEITVEVMTETVWTLERFYKVPRSEVAQKLTNLLRLSGIVSVERDVLFKALELLAASRAGFVDCLLAARSKHLKTTVYTFDEHDFKKLNADWKKP